MLPGVGLQQPIQKRSIRWLPFGSLSSASFPYQRNVAVFPKTTERSGSIQLCAVIRLRPSDELLLVHPPRSYEQQATINIPPDFAGSIPEGWHNNFANPAQLGDCSSHSRAGSAYRLASRRHNEPL